MPSRDACQGTPRKARPLTRPGTGGTHLTRFPGLHAPAIAPAPAVGHPSIWRPIMQSISLDLARVIDHLHGDLTQALRINSTVNRLKVKILYLSRAPCLASLSPLTPAPVPATRFIPCTKHPSPPSRPPAPDPDLI